MHNFTKVHYPVMYPPPTVSQVFYVLLPTVCLLVSFLPPSLPRLFSFIIVNLRTHFPYVLKKHEKTLKVK